METRPTIGVDGSVATEDGIQAKFDEIDAINTTQDTTIANNYTNSEKLANKGIANGYASLDNNGKVPASQLTVSAMEYKGNWDASTGVFPSSPNTGDMYVVSVTGTISSITYSAGGQIVYNGTTWDYFQPQNTVNASYATKGVVQGLTDANTSGLVISSGVISVNTGTGANQIVKLNSSGQLPAVDASLLTGLNVFISSATLNIDIVTPSQTSTPPTNWKFALVYMTLLLATNNGINITTRPLVVPLYRTGMVGESFSVQEHSGTTTYATIALTSATLLTFSGSFYFSGGSYSLAGAKIYYFY